MVIFFYKLHRDKIEILELKNTGELPEEDFTDFPMTIIHYHFRKSELI